MAGAGALSAEGRSKETHVGCVGVSLAGGGGHRVWMGHCPRGCC